MGYSANEQSEQAGAPVELYRFDVGVRSFFFTSDAEDVVFDSITYKAATISRSETEQSNEVNRQSLRITTPRDFVIADLFRVAPPSEVIRLLVRRVHRSDLASPAEFSAVWMGRVLNCTWRGLEAELTCESVYTSLRRPGLRRKYQRACPHVLYDGPCGVVDETFRVNATLILVNGATIQSPQFDLQPDGYYDGGFVQIELASGAIERRAIGNHIGTEVKMTHQIPALEAGMVVAAYPGCAHTLEVCASKFGNAARYGGQPYIPIKNPFGGSSLY